MNHDDNPPLSRDDRAALQALGTLDLETEAELLAFLESEDSDSEDSPRVREYLETLSLLPWALEPVAPRPELEGRIRAALMGDETQRFTVEELRPHAEDAPGPTPTASPATPPTQAPTPKPIPTPKPRPTPTVATAPSSVVVRAPVWLQALAAGLALCVLGLGWVAASQRTALGAQVDRVDRLEAELRAAQAETALAAVAPEEFEAMRSRFALLSDLGTEICALKPPTGTEAPQPAARGLMFVAADHQHWYIKAEGLAPVAAGQTYQLWFVVSDEAPPVSAGTFTVEPEREIELGSPQMPVGTKAVVVTVEPEGGTEEPTGPVVLYGDEVMQLLT